MRRGTRATLALAGASAVVAALVPGITGSSPAPGREQQPARTTPPQQTAAVDRTWVPRAKKVLAQVNADLSQIGRAERAAAAAAPRERWSARLRTLMARVEQRKADLLRQRNLLQADLSVMENYDQATVGLDGARKQLWLLHQAQGPLRALSAASQEKMDGILNGLSSQEQKIAQQERIHRSTKESLSRPAQQVSSKPLPDLPRDVGSLARQVDEAVEDSTPSAPEPGHGSGRPEVPQSDRPPGPHHGSPGKAKQTTAPPRPHSSKPVTKKPGKKGTSSGPKSPGSGSTKPAGPPKKPDDPPATPDGGGQTPPASSPQPATGGSGPATGGGTGAGPAAFSSGSDSGGSSGGTAGADAGTGSGPDSGDGSGSDGGADSGDSGGDSGDSGDSGGDSGF